MPDLRKISTAVVLAAGKGSRMGDLTQETPKPMLEVGGRPILSHIISGLSKVGISEIVIVTGHQTSIVKQFFGDGERFGVRITSVDQADPNGTGGAVQLVESAVGTGPFLLTYGDILTSAEHYQNLIAAFTDCDLVTAINPVDDPWRGAAVHFDEQMRVTSIIEKPPKGTSTSIWNNSGIYVTSPLIFSYTAQLTPSIRGELELTEAVRMMVVEGRRVLAEKLHGSWGDIGTSGDLSDARQSTSQ
jgi:dTDP-glucose pyrophosphorylase